MSIDRNGDPWCDYCGEPCGIGVYKSKSHPDKIFCEAVCLNKFNLGIPNGEEPDVVY